MLGMSTEWREKRVQLERVDVLKVCKTALVERPSGIKGALSD
jgi:hypothetical protein